MSVLVFYLSQKRWFFQDPELIFMCQVQANILKLVVEMCPDNMV